MQGNIGASGNQRKGNAFPKIFRIKTDILTRSHEKCAFPCVKILPAKLFCRPLPMNIQRLVYLPDLCNSIHGLRRIQTDRFSVSVEEAASGAENEIRAGKIETQIKNPLRGMKPPQFDKILNEYCTSGEPTVYKSNESLKLKCLQNNLRLLDMNVKHLGTDKNYLTMQNLIHALADDGVEMLAFHDCERAKK